MTVTTGRMPFHDGHTWYRITGRLEPGSGVAPLIVVHGGPGGTHNYSLAMRDLAEDGRAVVHYDQFGCGKSSHRPQWGPSKWTVELFVEELAALVAPLGVGDSYHLLGHSWGGMLGAEFVLRHPVGIRSLTICDSPASMQLWIEAATTLRNQLPADVQQTLTRHEQAGTTDSAEYRAATATFYARHVCRVLPMPPDVADSFAQIDADPTVYHAMNGPSEFHVVGSLTSWSIVDRLPAIKPATLVVAGEFDEAMPPVWQPFVDLIPNVRSHVFANASHMPHVERPDDFRRVVGDFLREHDEPMQPIRRPVDGNLDSSDMNPDTRQVGRACPPSTRQLRALIGPTQRPGHGEHADERSPEEHEHRRIRGGVTHSSAPRTSDSLMSGCRLLPTLLGPVGVRI